MYKDVVFTQFSRFCFLILSTICWLFTCFMRWHLILLNGDGQKWLIFQENFLFLCSLKCIWQQSCHEQKRLRSFDTNALYWMRILTKKNKNENGKEKKKATSTTPFSWFALRMEGWTFVCGFWNNILAAHFTFACFCFICSCQAFEWKISFLFWFVVVCLPPDQQFTEPFDAHFPPFLLHFLSFWEMASAFVGCKKENVFWFFFSSKIKECISVDD